MKKLFVLLVAAVMLATGASAAFEKVNKYENNFSDVADTAWYAENVKTAYELGFMNGKSEGKFDPNAGVTVVEGITMASRLHAIYNGTEVTKSDKAVEAYRFELDDPSIIVDLSERNSRNTNGINFNRANGRIEDGMLIVQPDAPNASGNYDPQIKFEGLELEAKNYNKVTFRMKRDVLPDIDDRKRNEVLEFYFQTSVAPNIDAEKCVYVKFPANQDLSDWFEVEADLGGHEKWTDVITGFRFDPTNHNGIYYIDYIEFSKSENLKTDKWYDMYIDYAVENHLIGKTQYKTEDYNRNITRAEICDMFASAIPESHFAPINDIKGIPDVLRDAKNADVYLTLYKAGVLLGDTNGNFNPDADIKRSEIAAIINRVALPESRVKGTVNADWSTQGNQYDREFNDASSLETITFKKCDLEVVNGALVATAQFMGADAKPPYDTQIGVENISLNAEDYTKLRVRMKIDFIGENDEVSRKGDFYFKTSEDAELSETKALHADFGATSYMDPFGWYIIDVDFATHKEWKGNITGFRFDPANANGKFTIDYIRLVKADPLKNASHETLIGAGYEATYLMQDSDWENGFQVGHYEHGKVDLTQRQWTYGNEDAAPVWRVAPLWSKVDLWESRDTTTDKYTLKDTKGVNTVVYNPEEKSVSLRLDATKVHNGEPHNSDTTSWWPHLLLDQPESVPVDPVKNSVNVDRMYIELDMRVTDFKDTINQEGDNNCSFLAYFYLKTTKNPAAKIWYGLTLFTGTNSSTSTTPGWAPDSAAHMYMYAIRPADIYGGIENSFNPAKGQPVVGEEWKHIRVDITEHIDRCIEWANRDKAYGVEVSKEDLYFSGGNIGFEIWGNYDCTVEIKNLDIVSYNLAD